jgi:thiol-disulfide isomerase/thioredoxin
MKYFAQITLIVALLIGGFWWYQNHSGNQPENLDAFTQCLKDEGAVFYGAFWCPHCQNQKALFGESAELLPYTECSTPDGQGRLPVCEEKKIEGYPTWIFSDDTRKSGEVPLEELAVKTGCLLPE